MKNFKLISTVSVAVLSMSVQVMASPLTTTAVPTSSQCVRSTLQSTCPSSTSTSQNCTNTLDIESILNEVDTADVIISNLNCNSNNAVLGTNCNKTITISNATTCSTNNSYTNSNCNNNTTSDDNNNVSDNNNLASSNNSSPESTTVTDNNTSNNNNTSTTTDTSVSAYAQEVVDLVNVERAKQGIAPLSIDPNVTKAAQVRAKEIKTSFSHTRPDGRTAFTALDEANASYRGAGENIAIGQKTPEQVVSDWMNSEGHRKNILNSSFKYIGVGVDGTAWTQLFTY